jgi:hypothetical protein
MDKHQQIMEQGRAIYERGSRRPLHTYCNRSFGDPNAQPAYILVDQRFISGHDDTAIFVELIGKDETILRSWMFEDMPCSPLLRNTDFYGEDCLVYYLREILKLEVVQQAWHRKIGELQNL